MAGITLEKIHAMLERMAEHVVNEVPTKKEVDEKFQKVDEKFEKVFNEIWNLKEKMDQKADKKDIQKILDGQDAMVNQLDIIRTEQYAFNAAFTRLEERVESLESGM